MTPELWNTLKTTLRASVATFAALSAEREGTGNFDESDALEGRQRQCEATVELMERMEKGKAKT